MGNPFCEVKTHLLSSARAELFFLSRVFYSCVVIYVVSVSSICPSCRVICVWGTYFYFQLALTWRASFSHFPSLRHSFHSFFALKIVPIGILVALFCNMLTYVSVYFLKI